jgi:hypothetical protein
MDNPTSRGGERREEVGLEAAKKELAPQLALLSEDCVEGAARSLVIFVQGSTTVDQPQLFNESNRGRDRRRVLC